MRKLIGTLGLALLTSMLFAGCNPTSTDLRAEKAMTQAKTGSFEVVGNQLRIRVWSPVDRVVGKVIDTITFISPTGEQIAFNVTGAVQVLNIASATVPLTPDQAATVDRLLETKGAKVRVKLRFETFTYVVE